MSVSRNPTVCVCGDHCFAAVTKGLVVLVSPQDAHHLAHTWQASLGGRSAFISRKIWTPATKTRRTVVLAREILKPSPGIWVDHISGDGTDNRRPNLRAASPQENSFNRRPERFKNVSSKGVCRKRNGRYQAQIMRGGHRQFLGSFGSEAEAALAYERAAQSLHGEFARIR